MMKEKMKQRTGDEKKIKDERKKKKNIKILSAFGRRSEAIFLILNLDLRSNKSAVGPVVAELLAKKRRETPSHLVRRWATTQCFSNSFGLIQSCRTTCFYISLGGSRTITSAAACLESLLHFYVSDSSSQKG